MQVNVYEAKTKLPALLERAAAGEEIIIAKRGKPMAILGPLPRPSKKRQPGLWEGLLEIGADFDAPLPEEIQQLFEGDRNE